MTHAPRCPYCPVAFSDDVTEHVTLVEASDRTESIVSSHVCNRCRKPFKDTPPDRPASKEDACS